MSVPDPGSQPAVAFALPGFTVPTPLIAALALTLMICVSPGLEAQPGDAPAPATRTVLKSLQVDIQNARDQLRQLIRTEGGDSLAVARLRARLGALLYFDGKPAAAVGQLRSAIPRLEQSLGLFNPALVEPLGYLGLSEQMLQLHEQAGDSLTRAQHITHRSLGTLNKNQIPLVYSKAESLQARGELWKAEQLQYMVYRLHKHNFGPEAPETMGALNQLGTWLTRVGKTRPALSLYRSALGDLRNEQNIDTPQMAPLLEGMARAFLFSPGERGRSLRLLDRVTKLTKAHPDTFGPGDHFAANLQLGDTLLLFSLERDAMKRYQEAWQTLENNPQLGDWERKQFENRHLVSGPFEELTKSDAGDRIYFHFSFDLRSDGRPYNVKLLDTSARPGIVSSTIALFRSVRFRPEFDQSGQPLPRPQQEIWLSYRSHRPLQT